MQTPLQSDPAITPHPDYPRQPAQTTCSCTCHHCNCTSTCNCPACDASRRDLLLHAMFVIP